MKEARG